MIFRTGAKGKDVGSRDHAKGTEKDGGLYAKGHSVLERIQEGVGRRDSEKGCHGDTPKKNLVQGLARHLTG